MTSLFGFYCYPKPWFSPVRVFHDEEHSTESNVLEISSSGNVVHALIGGVRVSLDATRIKIRNLFYQDCDFGYRQWT